MISSEAESAILALQHRGAQICDIYELERIDRALDEIVRNPENTSPAKFQVRSALANAGKIIKERRAAIAIDSLDQGFDQGNSYLGHTDPGFRGVEITAWIDSAPLPTYERNLLRRLAAGEEAPTLAAEYEMSDQRMRETISRVRRKARNVLAMSEYAA